MQTMAKLLDIIRPPQLMIYPLTRKLSCLTLVTSNNHLLPQLYLFLHPQSQPGQPHYKLNLLQQLMVVQAILLLKSTPSYEPSNSLPNIYKTIIYVLQLNSINKSLKAIVILIALTMHMLFSKLCAQYFYRHIHLYVNIWNQM